MRSEVRRAIDRIRQFQPKGRSLFEADKYQVGYSGGKDSECVIKLMEMAGVPFAAHYNVTTIDPPELVYHIRKRHPEVTWNRPAMHLLTRMVTKEAFPPTRRIRWCCRIYKESVSSATMLVLGIRNAEGTQRGKRRMVESCRNDSRKRYLNPIIDWTEDDVWRFIKDERLEACSLYDEGWKRLGCIGCPMVARKGRLKQFERWPGYGRLWKLAFQRMFKIRQSTGMTLYGWKSWRDMWDWWLAGKRNEKIVDQSADSAWPENAAQSEKVVESQALQTQAQETLATQA